ncbi:glycosyltransferase family 4 protein [Candidatus Peribacteria bacterium]|nr:glycosyltransferase family 4 protein [Candidatus Peribacteria bacterium]
MKIVLATGIYPPDIGGPATYCRALAKELQGLGHEVSVVTYGVRADEDPWPVMRVSKSGGPLLRWWRYSRVLKTHGSDADIVYAFSSVSCGVPLRMAGLKKPKKILRLGGDFLWERYTDRGGKLSLRAWYADRRAMHLGRWLLEPFHHIVFSSAFQRDLYLDHYKALPPYAVIENAVPSGIPVLHQKHTPLRILFLGRLVGFKHLPALLQAMEDLPHATLTIAGSGPLLSRLQTSVRECSAADRIRFIGNREGSEKQKLFHEHDLLVLPSLTEISPNVALEARAVGLPVLLTQETGLSASLQKGMVVRDLSAAEKITATIRDLEKKYASVAEAAAEPAPQRPWCAIAEEHMELFHRLVATR